MAELVLSKGREYRQFTLLNMQNIDSAQFTQLGALAIVFIFFLKEFFSYLKAKKHPTNGNYKAELANINGKLDNHLNTVNREVVDIRTDIKIIKNDISDIKISLKQ